MSSHKIRPKRMLRKIPRTEKVFEDFPPELADDAVFLRKILRVPMKKTRRCFGAFLWMAGLVSLGIPMHSQARNAPYSEKEPRCKIEILGVLESVIGRGPPYLSQVLSQDPERSAMMLRKSHGDRHLSCTYRISLNAREYRYRHEFSNTFRELKEEHCGSSDAKKKVKEGLVQLTNQCKTPRAQPVLGYALQPLP